MTYGMVNNTLVVGNDRCQVVVGLIPMLHFCHEYDNYVASVIRNIENMYNNKELEQLQHIVCAGHGCTTYRPELTLSNTSILHRCIDEVLTKYERWEVTA